MKLTAESTIFNDDKVQSKFTELVVDADGIRTEVSKKVGNTEIISRINQSAESVKIQADKIDITGTTTFSDGTSINSIAKDAADAIEVGGRNLFGYGSQCESLDGFTLSGTWDITTEDGYKCAHAAGALKTTKYILSKLPFHPKPKEVVTISGYIKLKNLQYGTTNPMCEFYAGGQTIDGVWRSINIDAVYLDGNKAAKPATNIEKFSSYISDTNWHHFAFVWTWNSYNFTANLPPFVFLRDCTGDLYVRNIKYERGNKPTDWTPAPEDVQAEIDVKKSVHTLMSSSDGSTYENILAWTAEGRTNSTWSINTTATPITNIKVGDTVRIAYKVTDMNNAYVYVIGEFKSSSGNSVSLTMHGLDTTIIDGGNILTNSIGANKIKVNELTIGQSQVSGLSTALANTEKLYKHNVDLTSSSYNQDTWYPVLIGPPPATDASIYFRCSITNGGGTPSWSSHSSKHWACEVEASYSASAWGWKSDNNSYIDAYTFGQTSTKPIVLSNALANSSYLVIYLRGGGYYPIQTSIADTPQIKTSSYTINSQTVTPTTTQPVNTENFVISRREGDTKANEAATKATNYISASSSGIRIASANPSTQYQRMELTSSEASLYSSDNLKRVSITASTGVVVGNANKGHTVVTDDGLSIYDVNNKKRSDVTTWGLNVYDTDGSTSVAWFGASARIGKAASNHLSLDATNGLQIFTGTESDSTNVAQFGSSIRIGVKNKARFLVNATSLQAYNSSNQKYFEVNGSTLTFTGTMSASKIKGDTLSLGGANNANGLLKLYSSNGLVVGQMDNSGIIYTSAQTVDDMGKPRTVNPYYRRSIKFDSGTIAFRIKQETDTQGHALTDDPMVLATIAPARNNLDITYDASAFQSGISYGSIRLIAKNQSSEQAGVLRVGIASNDKGYINLDAPVECRRLIQADSYFYFGNNSYGSYDFALGHSNGGEWASHGVDSGLFFALSGDNNVSGIYVINTSLRVGTNGYKSKLFESDKEIRSMYCYEMPSPMFGDIGCGQTDDVGLCYVDIDKIFANASNVEIAYQVFLQAEGEGNLWVAEKNNTYFVVKGTANLKFSWELKAKQTHFETERMEIDYCDSPSTDFLKDEPDYLNNNIFMDFVRDQF